MVTQPAQRDARKSYAATSLGSNMAFCPQSSQVFHKESQHHQLHLPKWSREKEKGQVWRLPSSAVGPGGWDMRKMLQIILLNSKNRKYNQRLLQNTAILEDWSRCCVMTWLLWSLSIQCCISVSLALNLAQDYRAPMKLQEPKYPKQPRKPPAFVLNYKEQQLKVQIRILQRTKKLRCPWLANKDGNIKNRVSVLSDIQRTGGHSTSTYLRSPSVYFLLRSRFGNKALT